MNPGDIGFARTTGFMGRLIRVGEWLKFRKSEFNHCFIIDRIENGVPYVIQATIKGVTDTAALDSVAPGGKCITFSPPDGVDVERLLAFARAQVGVRYSFLTILAIALDILSWDWVPSFMNAHRPSWICSGLTCEALRFGGWLHEWINVYTVMPQQAYAVLSV